MDVASILLILAAAGQSGWSSDRYSAPPTISAQPAASAPSYDRYSAPVASGSNVAPPPSVIDRARTAASETATTLRDGFEAGIQAANNAGNQFGQDVQGWADNAEHGFQAAGNNLRTAAEQTFSGSSRGKVTNPFAPPPTPSPTTAKTRSGAAPPPWASAGDLSSSESFAPAWQTDLNGFNAQVERVASVPRQMDGGWTSIGTDVPAPPLIVPQITNTPSPTSIAAGNGPFLPSATTGGQATGASASDADSWASSWNNGSNSQPPSIGRPDTQAAGISRQEHSVAAQPVNSAAPNSQPASRTSQLAASDAWPDLWADNPPQQQSPQADSASPLAAGNAASVTIAGKPANQANETAGAANFTVPAGSTPAGRTTAGQAPLSEQPPWIPLILVSLSLAGSIGANLFLGFSYLDARQKYRSLVRKTAEKFRRSSAAAA